MQYETVPGLDARCSKLVLGTANFGKDREDHWRRLLDAFVRSGGNCVDTALIYHDGESETLIGRWLADRGLEDRVIVLGKGCHPDLDTPVRVTPEAIREDLNRSLDRLQLPIDLYMLHRDDEDVPVGELVDALTEHQQAGKIRAFGGSNWKAHRLAAANEYAQRRGVDGFIASSPNMSLAPQIEPRWRGCLSLQTTDLAWYEESGMAVFSWSSQAAGFFTGRFSPDQTDDEHMVRVYYSDDNWARLARAERLAAAKGVTTNQIALAYVLNHPFPTFAIIGPADENEFQSSRPAAHIALTREEVTWLDGRNPSPPEGVR